MDFGLKGKVSLVAAASRGLGRAVAEELAVEGASLILCARNESTLSATCDSIRKKYDVSVLGVAADLSVAEDVERVVHDGLERFGQIDILVTNAGGPPAGTFESLSRGLWEQATHLTLNSVLNLTRAFKNTRNRASLRIQFLRFEICRSYNLCGSDNSMTPQLS